MNFDFDVFVSYAHLDDAAVEDDQKGWVAKLHEKLEHRLGQLLGKSPRIWRDPKLEGDDVFAEILVDRLRRAAVFVSVVSPRYVRSDWTRRELTEFCKAAEQQGGIQLNHKSRIFKVLKTPVPLDQQSPPLPSLLGYEFYKVDPENGNFREFDAEFGPEYQQKFNMKLDDLAQDLKDLLEVVEREVLPSLAEPDEHRAVFLAVTTLDLHDQREAIKRDLLQHGYTVLPARELSQIGSEVDTEVREDLARCSMSIHLIGKRYSLTPEGAEASLVEIQNQLATERCEQGGFSRLVWIPQGLQTEDARQRKVIDQLRTDPRMGKGADLLESPLEALLTVVQDTLDKTRVKKPAPPPGPDESPLSSVYLMYDERDTAVVSPWADFMFDKGIEVIHPVFVGDEAEVREYHEENLRTSDGVLIFFGAANEVWLRRKFRELQKIAGYGRTKPAPVVAVCLLPPKTPEKDRFRTHECLVVPQWNGLSPDPWLPIIARLKG